MKNAWLLTPTRAVGKPPVSPSALNMLRMYRETNQFFCVSNVALPFHIQKLFIVKKLKLVDSKSELVAPRNDPLRFQCSVPIETLCA